MREKPFLEETRIIDLLLEAYGLNIAQVEFLPLGADFSAAVYRVATGESELYFLKLRTDNFEEISLLVPQFLHEKGIRQVIPPQKTKDGQLWAALDVYTCILYPYIEGRDGFKMALSGDQWVNFGAALRGIHAQILPRELQVRIPSEEFSSYWREMVEGFLAEVGRTTYTDPVAAELAAFILDHSAEIRFLIERAGQLAGVLQSQPHEWVLCHSDIHAGNLLLTKNESLYIVDWDTPILAPKERDLMFIGGGVGGIWNSAREEAGFYQGYGPAEVNRTALTYYRYERIVEDIAAFCEQILSTQEGGADREQGLRYFTSQFLPNSVFDIARQTDQNLKEGWSAV